MTATSTFIGVPAVTIAVRRTAIRTPKETDGRLPVMICRRIPTDPIRSRGSTRDRRDVPQADTHDLAHFGRRRHDLTRRTVSRRLTDLTDPSLHGFSTRSTGPPTVPSSPVDSLLDVRSCGKSAEIGAREVTRSCFRRRYRWGSVSFLLPCLPPLVTVGEPIVTGSTGFPFVYLPGLSIEITWRLPSFAGRGLFGARSTWLSPFVSVTTATFCTIGIVVMRVPVRVGECCRTHPSSWCTSVPCLGSDCRPSLYCSLPPPAKSLKLPAPVTGLRFRPPTLPMSLRPVAPCAPRELNPGMTSSIARIELELRPWACSATLAWIPAILFLNACVAFGLRPRAWSIMLSPIRPARRAMFSKPDCLGLNEVGPDSCAAIVGLCRLRPAPGRRG